MASPPERPDFFHHQPYVLLVPCRAVVSFSTTYIGDKLNSSHPSKRGILVMAYIDSYGIGWLRCDFSIHLCSNQPTNQNFSVQNSHTMGPKPSDKWGCNLYQGLLNPNKTYLFSAIYRGRNFTPLEYLHGFGGSRHHVCFCQHLGRWPRGRLGSSRHGRWYLGRAGTTGRGTRLAIDACSLCSVETWWASGVLGKSCKWRWEKWSFGDGWRIFFCWRSDKRRGVDIRHVEDCRSVFFFLKTFCCKCFLYVLKSFLSGLSFLYPATCTFQTTKDHSSISWLRLWRRQPKLSCT